jgi:hypothetical protein
MQLATPMAPAQHLERLPLKGMALTNDRYLVREFVAVVGSLSSGSSTGLTTTC